MHQSGLRMSKHAIMRFAQRGFSCSDKELFMYFGTSVHDGYFMRRKDTEECERAAKRLLQRIKRLENSRLVTVDDTIVTAYHARKKKRRKLLRK